MSAPVVERDVEVVGELGLHARPAARFAEAAAHFASEVTVAKAGRAVDAKSVLMVLTLDVRCGDRIHLRARGDDAPAAIEQLSTLASAP